MQTRKKNLACAFAFAVFAISLGLSGNSYAVPSFARQTGMACQACHTVFPELTPFGRSFKLNGYQIDNLPQVAGINTSKNYELLLNQLPPLSAMFQVSYTSTSKPLPDSLAAGADSQNGQVLFPQQASLFYAGRIAQGLGAFIQMTYSSDSGSFGWDNTDIRYAKQVPLAADSLTLGVTLNNNPTVQDVWNSTPAWQTPFDQRTSAAPMPGAATAIDGGLADRGVAGVSVYAWWKNSIYAEFGLYRSSPQGFNVNDSAGPLDSSVPGGVLTSNAPYWRLAYEYQWDRNALSVGTYGVIAKISPEGQPVAPPSDRFRDVALDAQYQYLGDEHIFSVQSTYIREDQTLDGTFAIGGSDNPTNDLRTFRLAGSYYYQRTYGGALGYFSTTGSADATRYPATPVFGFANGSPDSKGWIAELDYVPWENVKLAAQYTAYSKFNGAGSNYDGSGRSASDNNTLYLLGWLAF
jgi:hypothetical protein